VPVEVLRFLIVDPVASEIVPLIRLRESYSAVALRSVELYSGQIVSPSLENHFCIIDQPTASPFARQFEPQPVLSKFSS
jgi:hypothetical protein